jgi:hypothetical protein
MDIETLVPLTTAAKRTSLSESCIRRGLKSGDIKGFKVARDWVLPPDQVKRLEIEYPLPEGEADRSAKIAWLAAVEAGAKVMVEEDMAMKAVAEGKE